MLAHILRDPAIRVLPWWLGIGAAITLHFFVISLHEVFQRVPWAWVPWFPVALYLLLIRAERRASELDLTLPVSARRLWLAHVLALGLGAAAILTVSAVVMALRGQIVAVPGAVAEVITTALRFAAGLPIVLALAQSWEPVFVRRSGIHRQDFFLLALLAGVPVIVLELDVGWLLALLAAALMLTFRTWRSLPPALTLAPTESGPPVPDAVPEPRPREPRSPAVHRWRFARRQDPAVRLAGLFLHLHAHGGRRPQQLCTWSFGWPGCVLLGLGLSGGAPPASDAVGSVLLLIVLPAVMVSLAVPLALTLRLMTMLDPLPVSRRFLFAATTLPAFAALALGFGIGAVSDRSGAYAATSAMALVLMSVLWLASTAFVLRSHHEWGCSLYGAALAILLAFLPVRYAAVRGWLNAPLVFTEAFGGELAAALPGGEAALRIVSVLVLGVAYVLAEARFRRFEVVPDRGEGELWVFADLRPYLRVSSGGAS